MEEVIITLEEHLHSLFDVVVVVCKVTEKKKRSVVGGEGWC